MKNIQNSNQNANLNITTHTQSHDNNGKHNMDSNKSDKSDKNNKDSNDNSNNGWYNINNCNKRTIGDSFSFNGVSRMIIISIIYQDQTHYHSDRIPHIMVQLRYMLFLPLKDIMKNII